MEKGGEGGGGGGESNRQLGSTRLGIFFDYCKHHNHRHRYSPFSFHRAPSFLFFTLFISSHLFVSPFDILLLLLLLLRLFLSLSAAAADAVAKVE